MLKIILSVIFIYPLINLVIEKLNKKTEKHSNRLFLSPIYKNVFHLLSSAFGIIGFILVFVWGFNKGLFHCIFLAFCICITEFIAGMFKKYNVTILRNELCITSFLGTKILLRYKDISRIENRGRSGLILYSNSGEVISIPVECVGYNDFEKLLHDKGFKF